MGSGCATARSKVCVGGPRATGELATGQGHDQYEPFGAEELAALTPIQAAEQIAAWRPAPGEWHDARQLGRVLEMVVQQNPDGWLADPVGITAKLFHPTYIRSYVLGVKEVVAGHAIPVMALLDVVTLVHTRPWPVEALADDPLD